MVRCLIGMCQSKFVKKTVTVNQTAKESVSNGTKISAKLLTQGNHVLFKFD